MPKDDKPRSLLIKEVITEPDKRLLIALTERRQAPVIGIFDEPTRCYRVNEQWAAHIAGAVSLLTEQQAWVGANDEQHSAIQAILQFLRGTVCGVLDCADVEACLQLSDLLRAIQFINYDGQLANTEDHQAVLVFLYDGTPQSIGASIPTTAPNLNSLHDNALCSVLNNIIRVYSFSKGASLVLLSGFGTWYQNTILAMRDIAGFVPNYFWYLLGDELYGCAADVTAATAALGDTDAIEEFACCLRDELKSVAMSQAVFDAAIATCVASLSGNAGIIACLFDGDNSLEHYLSFLEAYNFVLERQIAGEDFVCECVPDGWFWLDVDWDWSVAAHSGSAFSPIFSHTNPSNGELFSITARHTAIAEPAKSRIRLNDTGLPDTLVSAPVVGKRPHLLLWEDAVLGVMDGADAVGWPSAQRTDQGMSGALRQPGETFSFQWTHEVDLGGSTDGHVCRVRLLYKIVP